MSAEITDLTVVLHVGEVAVSLALAAEAVHVGRREDGVRARGETNLVIRYLESVSRHKQGPSSRRLVSSSNI